MSNSITEITRRAIFDALSAEGVDWAGRLREDEFLGRLYKLEEMPSEDFRYRTAAQDVYQHRVNWHDWKDDWVFYDSRFALVAGTDEQLLRFLCEMVHPAVRSDPEECRALVEGFNQQLKADGWQIVEAKYLSGRPVFSAQRIGAVPVFEEPTGWEKVDRQLQAVRDALNSADQEEDFQSVGVLCREVLISVAQEVYDPAKHPSPDDKDVSPTDADGMLRAFFSVELKGGVNEEARGHAKAALKLANALQHKRTATFLLAALAAEAAASIVNLVAIVAGRRGEGRR